MSAAGWVPLLAAVVYLAMLAGFAELVERRERLRRLAKHPAVYCLALGVYATTWSFYGSVGFAARVGYGFLAIHMGVAVSCLAIPVLWRPLAGLVRRQRFQSVADLLAFRFQSQAAGVLVTTFMVLALLPYLSLQLRAIVETVAALAPGMSDTLGPVYAGVLSVFAAGVGARWADAPGSERRRRAGLLGALALESLIKCAVLLIVGALILVQVFESPAGLERWLAEHPESLTRMVAPVNDAPWTALCLGAFLAAFLLPRQFHVAFVERPTDRAMRHAIWAFPALLLALNLPLPVLYWAGEAEGLTDMRADLWVLELARREGLGLLVFIGGISAASAMVLVSCVALAGMLVHHVVLPLAVKTSPAGALRRLPLIRRVVIVALVLAGFVVHMGMRRGLLVDLGLVSFAAVAQLVPGVFSALFWPRATRRGFLLGLSAGILVWAGVTFLPLLAGPMDPLAVAPGVGTPRSTAARFADAMWLSLLVNSGLLAIVSLLDRQRPAEAAAAAACVRGRAGGVRGSVPADVEDLEQRLAQVLESKVATAELERALAALGLDRDERRPLHLRELAETIERNLSEHIGPLAASMVVSGPDAETSTKLAAELQFLERRGEAPARSELERALDLVRRYLSRVLAELPLGVCAVDREGEIVVWNRALVELTRIEGGRVLGARPRDLSAPWAELLTTALAEGGQRERRIRRTGAGPQILRLTCTRLDEGDVEAMGAVLLVEDLSERRALLAELSHRDRLASVGRLAAGVAHEVLNPLTGILMVARNLARELEQLEDGAELDPELELPERLGTVVSEAQRIEVIVRGLLTFSRGRKYDSAAELERDRVELEPLVDEAVRIARLARRERSVEVGVECPTGLEIEVDGQQLIQVLVNLLTNAIDASPEGERVELRCTPTQDGAQLEVLDRGGGIEAELAERVFEPFFTTKTAGEGTGLGLAVSHRIIAAHGGTLSWSPRDGGGARFVVHLPDMLRGEREVSA